MLAKIFKSVCVWSKQKYNTSTIRKRTVLKEGSRSQATLDSQPTAAAGQMRGCLGSQCPLSIVQDSQPISASESTDRNGGPGGRPRVPHRLWNVLKSGVSRQFILGTAI